MNQHHFMNELFKKERKRVGKKQSEFAEMLGVDQSLISKIENGKSKPTTEMLSKMKELFGTDISLLFNKNQQPIHLQEDEVVEAKNLSMTLVPLVGQYAYAGYLSGYSDEEYLDELPKVPFMGDHLPKGEYIAFEVRGDSMEDGSIESLVKGDILICRKIKPELWRCKLHINKWNFVIVHRTEGIVVKRIAEHDTDRCTIKIHSLNPEYEDRIIDLNDVAQIFNVVQVTRSGRL